MRKKTLLWILLSASLVVLMSAGSVFAAGFALYEGGARGLVLGAGLTATADDASAVFYNPAGITQLKGTSTMLGVTAINPMVNVKTEGNITIPNPATQALAITGTDEKSSGFQNNWFYPPHAYFTQQLSDRFYLGAGIFSRFGLGTEYTPSWPGRYSSYNAQIQTLEFNPNIAYKISDKFSVAGGVNVTWLDLQLQKKVPFNYAAGTADVDVDLNGDAYGWGVNLAAHYKPCDWFSAGISWRSHVSIHLDEGGTVNFTKPAVTGPSPLLNAIYAASFNDTQASGDIRLPDMIFAGVAVKPVKTVTIGGGVYWTRWSTYDKLLIRFEDPITATGVTESKAKKDWDDVFRYMIGVEWNATDWMDLRLGYAYDETPVPDDTISYELPDSDRQYFSLGVGFHKGSWTLDLAYMYLLFDDRDIDARAADGILEGKVEDGYAHLISLSFGYKF